MTPYRDTEESLGAMLSRLKDEGKSFVLAQIDVYKQLALFTVKQSTVAVAMLVVALLLVSSAITALLVGFVLGLARWIGPVGAGAVVALVTMLIAGILVWVALKRLARPPELAREPEVVAAQHVMQEAKR